MRPVAITGIGAVSGYGLGVPALMQGLYSGRSALGAPPWGSASPVSALRPMPDKRSSSELALFAAREALGSLTDTSSLAIVGASTSGDMRTGEEAWRTVLEGGSLKDPLEYLWSQLCHQPTRAVRRALGSTGPCLTVSTACTSGACAIGIAAELVESGQSDIVLAFGADALCQITVHGFASLGASSPSASRPFDRDRDGLNLGEGAGALLLESEAHAAARGASVLGWVCGYGNRSDAWRLTAPHPQARGAISAMQEALGSLPAEQIDFVCAHGTGTPLNDEMEALAIRSLLPKAAIVGVKGAIGHTLGAAGAIEAVVCLAAMRDGLLPPNQGLGEPEASELDFVSSPRPGTFQAALSVNFAFGGHNSALLLTRDRP